MIRWTAPLALALTLAACAGATERDQGLATLDALNQAQTTCAAKGGTLRLKPESDPQSLDSYACERK